MLDNPQESPGENYRYTKDTATINRKTQDVLDAFENFVNSISRQEDNTWNTDLFRINQDRVIMIANRIEKRKDYYKVYHEGLILSEQRYFGLLVYWILKLQPCFIDSTDPDPVENGFKINESFAYFLFYQTLTRLGAEKGVPYVTTSNDLETRIMHAFTYWDLSKESLMLIMDLLSDQLEVFGNYREVQEEEPTE